MKGAWNLDGFTAALSSAAKSAGQAAVKVSKAVATEVVHGVVGAESLLGYHVEPQPVASCGPVWSIYIARNKKEGAPYPVVSAWVLDKRALTNSSGDNSRTSSRRLEALIELCRNDVQHLTRLKHPSVLRLVAPLEETRTQLVFLTEPVFASLDDVIHTQAHLPGHVQEQLRKLKLSELEIKHGMLQIADALTFLHNDAGIVHRSVNPLTIIITRSGAWKLAGFGFATPIAINAVRGNSFDYSDRHPSTLGSALQPLLSYVAPELVATGQNVSVLPSADVFSLALLAYELATQRPFLPLACSLIEYESCLRGLPLSDLPGAPTGLAPMLRQMLAPAPEARPPIASFAGCPYFMGDVHLRALKFLDSIIQKSVEQRAAFLHDLPNMAAQFDSRVLLYIVLPPLLQELRTKELQAAALPIVMTIIRVQSPEEFTDLTLPSLKPLLENATGETLLLLTRSAPVFSSAAGGKGPAAQLVPRLMVRALQSDDARCQEEALRQIAGMSDGMDYEILKKEVLQAVHATCLATTTASVRVSAFKAMAAVAGRVDIGEAEKMLATAATCVAVDKTAPTAMCVLGLGDALARKWGPKLAAERVLPTIAPLLVVPSLSGSQFATAAKSVRDIVALIEKSRAGSSGATDAGGAADSSSSSSSLRREQNQAVQPMRLTTQHQEPLRMQQNRQQSLGAAAAAGPGLDLDELAQWVSPSSTPASPSSQQRPSSSVMHLNVPWQHRKAESSAVPTTRKSDVGGSSASAAPSSNLLNAVPSTVPSTGGDWLADSLGYGAQKSKVTSPTAAGGRLPSVHVAAAPAVDPFSWPVSQATAPPRTAAAAAVGDPLNGLWVGATDSQQQQGSIASSGFTNNNTSSSNGRDPFAGLGVQHASMNAAGRNLSKPTQGGHPQPSLI